MQLGPASVTGSSRFVATEHFDAKGHGYGVRFSDVTKPGWGPMLSGWSILTPDARRIVHEDFTWSYGDWYEFHPGDLELLDASNGRRVARWVGYYYAGSSLDGQTIVLSFDGFERAEVEIIAAGTGVPIASLQSPGRAYAAALSPDRKHVALLVGSWSAERVCIGAL
jgi:hypothetical protein